ncbi:redox-sensing transcriptional repressor Rex [Eubacterium uniforme]|uniref:Redox-sensing transcriptional repressor Rex n=1 Tax=Eubacterium uniforme TaxID=39495 RepID=A0A1T4VZW8_9FIRM|nr:redox-sensing transcriptional repressor Rex [Eubacterium uniforme]SKA70497.1 redox-sensing transcriptional repressor [Eubacterium uniforme]HAH17752.1 redox-sensing transcriptional repressor Rex [Eubacterium sp.]HAV91242.1 redox-sensing transcriptional repressor Rex [Eubacterium sp.]
MKSISKAVISRLPRYYRYLGELKEEGIERISSGDLSERMHVTASQIRQDLNNFGGFGQQGYGYNVSYLYDEIGKILNLDKDHSMVIIGAGHLGQAIANYANFEKRGFKVIALFDKNPEVIGKIVRNVEVLDIDGLENYLNNNKIDIVALTLPKEQATKIADTLVACGIKAIWNFAHTDLELPDDVIVENVHLSESLMKLAYNYGEIENR